MVSQIAMLLLLCQKKEQREPDKGGKNAPPIIFKGGNSKAGDRNI